MKECLKGNASIDPYGLSQGRAISIELLYLYFLQLENVLSYITNLTIDKYGKYFMILLRHPLYYYTLKPKFKLITMQVSPDVTIRKR